MYFHNKKVMDKEKDKGGGGSGSSGAGGEGGSGEGAGAGAGDGGAGSGAGAGDGDAGGEGDLGEFADPKKAMAEIKKLRAENAKHRTGNKDLASKVSALEERFGKLKKTLGAEDEDDIDPEEKIKKLADQNQALQLEVSVSKLKRDLGIPAEEEEYFDFLLGKAFNDLGDGEEITEEALAEIQKKVKARGGSASGASTGAGAGKKQPADNGGKGDLTVEEFVKMSMGQKSGLFQKDRASYDRLFQAAREKRLL